MRCQTYKSLEKKLRKLHEFIKEKYITFLRAENIKKTHKIVRKQSKHLSNHK